MCKLYYIVDYFEWHNFLHLELSIDNSQPKHKGNKCLVNGLFHHKDDKHNCKLIHNRNKNAVKNMLKIVSYLKEKGRHPKIFRIEKIEK